MHTRKEQRVKRAQRFAQTFQLTTTWMPGKYGAWPNYSIRQKRFKSLRQWLGPKLVTHFRKTLITPKRGK